MAARIPEIARESDSTPDTSTLPSLAADCWNWTAEKAGKSKIVAKVVGEGLALGFADGAEEAWKHKKTTAVELVGSIGTGLIIGAASRGSDLMRTGAILAGIGFAGAFACDTLRHGKAIEHAIAETWRDGATESNVTAMKRNLGSYVFDTSLMMAGGLTGMAAVRVPADLELRFGVPDRLTAEPMRTLIQMDDYGSNKKSAAKMERIVVSAREGVLSGKLQTGQQLEQFIAGKYLPQAHGESSGASYREYASAGLLSKHEPYRDSLRRLVGSDQMHTATANLGGKEFQFIRTTVDHDGNPGWHLPLDKAAIEATRIRTDELFSDLLANRVNFRQPTYMDKALGRVAEMEWLNAQTWRYPRGSAGVAQLQARTWLELSGIDSGRYKEGIDPNMEALTRSLPDFKASYPTFFERAQRSFNDGTLRRLLPGSLQKLYNIPSPAKPQEMLAA